MFTDFEVRECITCGSWRASHKWLLSLSGRGGYRTDTGTFSASTWIFCLSERSLFGSLRSCSWNQFSKVRQRAWSRSCAQSGRAWSRLLRSCAQSGRAWSRLLRSCALSGRAWSRLLRSFSLMLRPLSQSERASLRFHSLSGGAGFKFLRSQSCVPCHTLGKILG